MDIPSACSKVDVMTSLDQAALDWLLACDEPGIRLRVRRELRNEAVSDSAFEDAAHGPKASALLAGLGPHGAPGNGWGGAAVWRCLALLDLGVPGDGPRLRAAADYVIARVLRRPQHQGRPTVVNGLHRFCANVEGHALIIGSRIGLVPGDPRLERLANALIDWQWPDGGWNCHRNARRRSTFHESLPAARGLHEYATATGDSRAAAASRRTAELFLQHRLIYSLGTGTPSRRQLHPPTAGEIINDRWAKLSYPSYWHYDFFACLRFLVDLGLTRDPRVADALELLRSKRRADGLWAADRQWWTIGGRYASKEEAVDWGQPGQPSELITFHALRILRSIRVASLSR